MRYATIESSVLVAARMIRLMISHDVGEKKRSSDDESQTMDDGAMAKLWALSQEAPSPFVRYALVSLAITI